MKNIICRLYTSFRFLEYRSVNDNILKCLNFLGNYSLTAGEITGVLGQVSKYMEEPLKGVMEECAYEAQMTGNSSTALLAMAEKVEHPKFKELALSLIHISALRAVVRRTAQASGTGIGTVVPGGDPVIGRAYQPSGQFHV